MRHLLTACVLLLPLTAVSGQQSPLQPGAPTQSNVLPATIEGVVMNAQTGEPIPHAQIMIFARTSDGTGRLEPRQANTDLSGRFTVGDLSPGRYRLRADADHFAPQAYGASPGSRWPGRDLVIDSGEHVRELTFRLMPCGSISGTVFDENGKPAVGATIRALPMLPGSGSQEAQANSRGQYRVKDLNPDQYFVQVTFSKGEPAEASSHETYPATYYPGTLDAETAVTVPIEAGSETDRIDVDLRPVHAARVRGQVLNPGTNQPAQDGWVMLIPRDADGDSRAAAIAALSASRFGVNIDDAQGHFEIDGVPAGSYWVYATVSDKDRSNVGRVPIEVADADLQGIRLALGASIDLSGGLRVEPEAAFDFSRLTVSLSPQEPLISRHQAQPAAAGNFVFQDVEPGTYRLNVQGLPQGYYLKSARLGGGEVLDTGLTIDSATSASRLDILLASPGGSLSGLVLNDDAPAQATVCLVPDSPRRDRRDLYLRAPTRPDGTYSLTGIAPGDYKLFAFEDADLRTVFNPTLLGAYEAKGKSVHIDEGRSDSVRLDVIPAGDEP
jgi:hypothetical protein